MFHAADTFCWSRLDNSGHLEVNCSQSRRLQAQTLPTPITIPALRILGEKNPVFDGRVPKDLGTYQSLDEGHREMLKEHGLIVISLIHNNDTCIDINFKLPKILSDSATENRRMNPVIKENGWIVKCQYC